MALDLLLPIPCDPDVYELGIEVMHAQLSCVRMEQFVRLIREQSGQRVDWHYDGGTAIVKTLGDLAKVRECLKTNLEMFLSLRKDYIDQEKMHAVANPRRGYVLL